MIALRRALERKTEGEPPSRWRTFDAGADHPVLRSMGALSSFDEERFAPNAPWLSDHVHHGELVTYVVDGVVEYHDETGASGLMRQGTFRRFPPGASGRASAQNASAIRPAHVFQMEFRSGSGRRGSAQQCTFGTVERASGWCAVASSEAHPRKLQLACDARVLSCVLSPGQLATAFLTERSAWLHLVSGDAALGGQQLAAGDGALIRGEPSVVVMARTASECLLIEVIDEHEEALWNGD